MGDGSNLLLEREQGTQQQKSEVSLCDLYGIPIFKSEIEETNQINVENNRTELNKIENAVFFHYEKKDEKELDTIKNNTFLSTSAMTKYDVKQNEKTSDSYSWLIYIIVLLIMILITFAYANKKKKERKNKIDNINDCFMQITNTN